MLIFSLHCQLFLLISGYYTICNIRITYQCKILIVPEEGWFDQPKYTGTRTKKSFYVVSTSASFFFVLYVKPIRSLLIQRTPAGSSFRLFALNVIMITTVLTCILPRKSFLNFFSRNMVVSYISFPGLCVFAFQLDFPRMLVTADIWYTCHGHVRLHSKVRQSIM